MEKTRYVLVRGDELLLVLEKGDSETPFEYLIPAGVPGTQKLQKCNTAVHENRPSFGGILDEK